MDILSKINKLKIEEFPKDKEFRKLTKEQIFMCGQVNMLFRVIKIIEKSK